MPKDTKTPDYAHHIRTLAQLLQETQLGEIEYETETWRIRVALPPAIPITSTVAPTSHPVSAPAPHTQDDNSATEEETHLSVVTSPLVGTVYRAPEPNAPPFIQQGGNVKEGDTLFIIEAMKTMNPVKAPCAGVIEKILVTDASPVEYGEKLVLIDPR
ncbi:MAG: acetyl-CoA carboxylase, biotin carboxyl carrier protein [Alphaproteobacteria bacterium GM7ARS4]|nr:acetyl-CoA carboxylase, biotin carboxyl carrier protein [Alphaproteobacteria bacterium GM7ARS4]